MRRSPLSIFLPSLNGGGAERAMLIFASEALKLGYCVDVVVAKLEGALVGSLPRGVDLVDLQSARMLTAIPKLSRYLNTRAPAALFATITHANIAAAWAARHARISAPLVIRQSNAPLSETQDSFGRMLTSHLIPWSYKMANGIIAVSKGVKDQLVSINPKLEATTHVLPTPVLTQELQRTADVEVQHRWFDNPSVPVVVSAGRLKAHKGMLDLVRAFRRVRDVRPARLLILGEGPERPRLEEEVVRLGLQNDVDLPGFMPNPFPYMKRATVFVLASHYEGLPNVLIQAMGLGTPVVATDCESGPAEIVEFGKWGKLVPLRKVEALADAIVDSLSLARQLPAQQRVWERFGAEQATREYLAVAGL